MRKSKLITISLAPEFYKKVNLLAKEENRTRSEFIREAVRRYMEEREREKNLKAFGEQLDRLWTATKNSGMSEDEVSELVAEAIQETRQRRDKEENA